MSRSLDSQSASVTCPAQRSRPCFAFSLRALLICMTLAGILCGIIATNLQEIARRREFAARCERDDFGLRKIQVIPYQRAEIPWLRRLLGDHARSAFLYIPPNDPDCRHLREAQKLFPEAQFFGPPGLRDLPPGVMQFRKDQSFII